MIIFASLAGFLLVATLLFTGHPGFALKIANYLYFLLLLGILLELLRYARNP